MSTEKLIKKIRVKKEDETLSDYIPIGVDAENVKFNNNESLEDKLNKTPYYYNTVADMKADLKLKINDVVETLGYYDINDGGASEYKIISGDYEDDGGTIHQLNNGLFAKLIVKGNIITPLQFGAKHDNETDDYLSMQKCLNMLSKGKAKILDLKGYSYIINHGLALDAMYKVTIKNGQLISTNFVLDEEDETKNYIMYGTNKGEKQPGSYGYHLEDVIFDTITFECYQQPGLGCVYLRKYFRLTFVKCDFRRFMTYGIKDTNQLGIDGHELLVSHCWFRGMFHDNGKNLSTGVAIEIAHGDNCFRDLIIAGCRIGIQLLGSNASFNQFSNIHFYQFTEYALKISQTCLTFDQMYFDNNGVYIEDPWYVTFSNCMWLGGKDEFFSPVTLAKKQGEGAYREINGVYFYGCVVHLYHPTPPNLIAFPHGEFTNVTGKNIFQFSGYGFINNALSLSNNKSILVDNTLLTISNGWVVKSEKKYDNYNPFKINTDTTPYFFFENGGKITSVNRYTYKIAGNELNVTDYDSTNWTWIGFLVDLKHNTSYRITNKYNHANTHMAVYGYNSLENGSIGTKLKPEVGVEWAEFNSEEYNYYFVCCFGLGKFDIEINEIL